MNGEALGQALRFAAGKDADGLYLNVADLRRAVDGTASHSARLQLDRVGLFAASRGGCDTCQLRLNRTVIISRALRSVDGVVYLPMPDLVRALEGRVSVNDAAGVLTIHVGRCEWCILDPRR